MGKINFALLNCSALNASRLNLTGEAGKPGGGAGGYWPAGTPAAIRRSAVLWYDIAKQGATNETMAENPVLKDLSGHGHDATCYNFAWAVMSGIGGFVTNYKTYNKYRGVEVNDHVITSTTVGEGEYNWLIFIDAKKNEVPSYKIRVTGTTSLTGLIYRYVDENNTVQYFNIQGDGEYTLPAIHHYNGDELNLNCGFQIDHREPLLIIEQLPQYPGALVSDGVDDYAYVDGLPLLDDFTFITKRTINAQKNNSVGAVKGETDSGNTNNAFGFDVINRKGDYYYASFGVSNIDPSGGALGSSEIVVGTPSKINDFAVSRGDIVDNYPYLWLMGYSPAARFAEEQLYTFLLFDRTLTDEEIEWVKANLMDEAEPEPTPELDASLVDAWVFSGYRNEDAPKSVTGEKGHALALGNFAYAEGSGFADGLLVTDGVDDYAENLNMPALTDYTFITRRTLMNFEAYASVASKASGAGTNGAFLFECRDLGTSGPVPNTTASFEAIKEGTIINNAIPEEVSWQTKTSYNGKTLSPGNLADGKLFYLASTRTTGHCVAAKFAWCALYDRSLTQEEINAEVAKLDALWEARKV